MTHAALRAAQSRSARRRLSVISTPRGNWCDGVTNTTFAFGVRRAAMSMFSPSLSTGADTGLTVSGPFSIGEDGLIDATLRVTVRDPRGLSAVFAEAFPEKRSEITSAFSALGFMGNDPTLPLVIECGEAKFAFFKLGDIPPI